MLKRIFLVYGFILVCVIFYLYLLLNKESLMSFSLKKLKSNVSCYYSVERDALPSAEDPAFSPGDNAIFFHETSCRGSINSRQACAVETAARLHPNSQINLLFTVPVREFMLTTGNLAKLREFPNVKFARVHIEKYSKGTPVEPILTQNLNQSKHLIEHASDILRIVTLWKFGGIYLDTDCILVRSLSELPPNWIAKESNNNIASGAMSFSKKGVGELLTTAILKEIHDTYNPDGWSNNGPKAIQRVLERYCSKKSVQKAGNCKGITIYQSNKFYPVYYEKYKSYFENGSIDDMEEPYMHHMWNFLSKDLTVESNSPYAKLARKYCPTIYEMYGNTFGK